MLRLIGICLTLAGSFGSGLVLPGKSRHAGTLFCWRSCFCGWRRKLATAQSACRTYFPKCQSGWQRTQKTIVSEKEEASALAEALASLCRPPGAGAQRATGSSVERRTRCMGSSDGALEGRSQKAAFLCKGAGLSRPGTTKTVDAQAVRRIQKPAESVF